MKIVSIVGARPQFIKLAPLARALGSESSRNDSRPIKHRVFHTGQHYDYLMDKVFFDHLGLPEPDVNLEVGSASHAVQTAAMLRKIEAELLIERPDWVLIYGDTNSTLAGALAAVKMKISVGHIEAGLRSYNRKMPEEINRITADRCAEVLFCPTENACRILKKENIPHVFGEGKLMDFADTSLLNRKTERPLAVNVGDVMFDAALMGLHRSEGRSGILTERGLTRRQYYLATVHRAENTDVRGRLESILEALAVLGRKDTVVFLVHPRTKARMKTFGLSPPASPGLRFCDPVGYMDMLVLEENARCILTDSGGMQKEAFFLGVPCVTLRDETEWPETVDAGANVLAGVDKEAILTASLHPSLGERETGRRGPFGDGKAADRIKKVLERLSE